MQDRTAGELGARFDLVPSPNGMLLTAIMLVQKDVPAPSGAVHTDIELALGRQWVSNSASNGRFAR